MKLVFELNRFFWLLRNHLAHVRSFKFNFLVNRKKLGVIFLRGSQTADFFLGISCLPRSDPLIHPLHTPLPICQTLHTHTQLISISLILSTLRLLFLLEKFLA